MIFGGIEDFGQNGQMPSRREPAADMPASADRAFRALSSRARVDVLRLLLSTPDRTRPQIVESTGLSAAAVRISLEELERLGYVAASEAPGARHGRRVTYSVLSDQLRSDHRSLMAYIYGPTVDTV